MATRAAAPASGAGGAPTPNGTARPAKSVPIATGQRRMAPQANGGSKLPLLNGNGTVRERVAVPSLSRRSSKSSDGGSEASGPTQPPPPMSARRTAPAAASGSGTARASGSATARAQTQQSQQPPFAWRTILRDPTARRCVQNLLERPGDDPSDLRAELSRLMYGAAIEQCLVELSQSCREGAPEAYISHAWGDPVVEAKLLQVEADLRLGGIKTYFEKKPAQAAPPNTSTKTAAADRVRAAERIIVFGSSLLMKKFKAQIGTISEELTPIIGRFTAELKRTDKDWPSVIPVVLDGAASSSLPEEFHDVVYTDFASLTDPASYFKSLLYLLFSLYGEGYADAQDRIDRVRELWEVRAAEVERRLTSDVPDANLAAEIKLAAELLERCRPLKTNVDLEVFQQPPPSASFTARPQHLGALRRSFPLLHHDRQTICLLHGPQGSGKTQTAVAYATRGRTVNYGSVIWLQAQNEPKMLVQLTEVAKALELSIDVNPRDDKGLQSVAKDAVAMATGLPLAERLAETARNVCHYLARHPGWLLVVDDVESASAWTTMIRHLPQCGGHILVTSREQALSGIDFAISMNPLELGVSAIGNVFRAAVSDEEGGRPNTARLHRGMSEGPLTARGRTMSVPTKGGDLASLMFDPRQLAAMDAQSLMTAAFALMRAAHEKMVQEAVAAIMPGAAAVPPPTGATVSMPPLNIPTATALSSVPLTARGAPLPMLGAPGLSPQSSFSGVPTMPAVPGQLHLTLECAGARYRLDADRTDMAKFAVAVRQRATLAEDTPLMLEYFDELSQEFMPLNSLEDLGSGRGRVRARLMPTGKYDIFISCRVYNGLELVRNLRADLFKLRPGLSVLVDFDGVLTPPEIQAAVLNSRCVLLLLTDGTLTRDFIKKACQIALQKQKPIVVVHDCMSCTLPDPRQVDPEIAPVLRGKLTAYVREPSYRELAVLEVLKTLADLDKASGA